MSLTIKTIAQKANVSPATVSLALKGDCRVAEKTAQKIKQLVEELGYVPNNFGRGLQANRSSLIGYFAHSINASYHNDILQGAGEAAAKAGYGLLVAISDGSEENDMTQLRLFREKRVDAIIASGGSLATREKLKKINENETPVILASTFQFDKTIPCIINDDLATGELAAKHLMESGYKNFIYYFNNDENLRAKGFMEECRKNNQIVSFCKTPKTLLKTLKKHPKSTGIFADHDAIAAEVIHLLRKNKFKIPQQVGIVGVDDAPFASLSELNITTFAPQKKQIGALTVESALKSINGEKVSSIFLKPELIVRKTTKNN